MIHTIKDKFIYELNERITNQQRVVAAGKIENMKEYGFNCGVAEGLGTALRAFEDFCDQYYKTLIEDEDR